jgi:hypothetical protein
VITNIGHRIFIKGGPPMDPNNILSQA